MDTSGQAQRLRITFSQGGALRNVGHLDMVRTWERALRRAGVPLAYSEGFNPQAKLQFASGLPLGTTGQSEIVDVVLTQPMPPPDFADQVTPHLPPGLAIVAVEEAPLKTKALQGLLRSSDWQADVQTPLDAAEMQARVAVFMESAFVPASRQRKGRRADYDLRSLVLVMKYDGEPEPGWRRLSMTLRSEPAATGRVDAVLAALELADASARIERLRLTFVD